MLKAPASLIICLLGLFCENCFGQDLIPDSINYSGAALAAINYFDTAIGERMEFYNGISYALTAPATKGTFYFEDKITPVTAIIRYNGIYYKDVPVIYDEHTDEMVSSLNGQLFTLIKSNLSDVYLSGHHFINIPPGNLAKLPPGFYDVVYNGYTQVLVRRTKIIEEHVVPPQTAETYYVGKITVYIKKDDSFMAISSKSDFLKLFQKHRSDFERYFDTNKADFRNDTETAVIKTAAWYDQLNK